MKSKRIRERGKIRFSDYFKQFKQGERVSVVKESSLKSGHPKRIVGKAGKITGSRGRYKILEVKDGKKIKTFIIHPVHLKKLK